MRPILIFYLEEKGKKTYIVNGNKALKLTLVIGTRKPDGLKKVTVKHDLQLNAKSKRRKSTLFVEFIQIGLKI